MKKEKLITEQNKELYETVRDKYKVNLKRSDDHSWGSNIERGKVIISHAPTKHPISAFTHELLHIDTQLNGYKRITQGVSLNQETHLNLVRLCDCIDNEFQHHKMFRKFIELGFPPEEFYNDKDTEVIPYLEKVISKNGQSIISLSVDYLTLIAPGGTISKDKIKELKQLFYNYENEKHINKFKKNDEIIKNWINDTSYNAEKYIIQLFKNLDAGQTWISYEKELSKGLSSQNFPSSGFFTDNNFTLNEIVKAFGK